MSDHTLIDDIIDFLQLHGQPQKAEKVLMLRAERDELKTQIDIDLVKTGRFAAEMQMKLDAVATERDALKARCEKLEKVVDAVRQCRAIDAIHLSQDGTPVEDLGCFARLEEALRELDGGGKHEA